MAILSAENNFKKGLLAIVDDNYEDAARYFRNAIDIHEQRSLDRPNWRYLSYYGLSMAKAFRPDSKAIEACMTAAAADTRNPEFFLNLGRVYRVAGKWDRAIEAFTHGLRVQPDHRVLRDELEQSREHSARFMTRTG